MNNFAKTIRTQPSLKRLPWGAIFKRASIIAIILGSSLTLINQTEAVFGNATLQFLPLVLVFFTPFLVVSISQMFGIRAAQKLTGIEIPVGFLGTLFTPGILIRSIALGLAIGITNIIIVVILTPVRAFDQLPMTLMMQGLTLPILFGAISQALSFRRAVAQISRT